MAPCAWHRRIAQYLTSIGFHMSNANHSLYVHMIDKGIVAIVIYLDDLIIGGDSLEEIKDVKRLLRNKFGMKNMGELHYFLGIKMIRTPEGIWLS